MQSLCIMKYNDVITELPASLSVCVVIFCISNKITGVNLIYDGDYYYVCRFIKFVNLIASPSISAPTVSFLYYFIAFMVAKINTFVVFTINRH